MFATFLRENLAVRQGFLHVLWADPNKEFEKGQFAVMFAPSDADGPMKPHYCRGLKELSRFLEKVGITTKGIENILTTVKRERSASELLSLAQSVIQIFDPLAERVEYAVLKIVAGSRLGPGPLTGHQNPWGNWMRSATEIEPECTQADLLSAFKRLRSRGVLRLTKADSNVRYEGSEYSGNDRDDDAFFFTADFNAVLTDEGRSYWDSIR